MAGPSRREIREMFDDLAAGYDRFNSLFSVGLDAFLRGRALARVRPGMRILDVGTGTGDLAIGAARRMKGAGEVVGLDFSAPMLRRAAEKAQKTGVAPRIRWVEKGAEEIPFEEALYDGALSGYVLRNLYENIETILRGIHRALKPGGWVSFVDLTEPRHPIVRRLGFAYLQSVTKFWGKFVFGPLYPETYLEQSMKRFLKRDAFVDLLKQTGFRDIRAQGHAFGMVTHYTAAK